MFRWQPQNIGTKVPLPENQCGGNLKSKHPCRGGATRDGRDRFLHFHDGKNNGSVSQGKCEGALGPHLQELAWDKVCKKALRLCGGIVSLADYKTHVWRFRAWQTLAEAHPVSGCVRGRKFRIWCRILEQPGLISSFGP